MALANAGAAAFGHTATLQVERTLAQLLRLRVAQINNCSYCLLVHHAAARTAEIPPPKVETLTAWWETHLFSEAERAALAYTEALTRAADATVNSRLQEAHDRMTTHFTEGEILEIVGIVINMNIWTRLKLAEGAMPTTAPTP
ncbi:carboxymuconolactone decarboxylase family protein [Micromonospora inaquosa]|uniref:Carboxymuconolactone decarboxylase family protein n=1 Tax=Micromonospora inaquosa TaxID=2203716 RepID=A0A3N9WU54_9ACTN|nr:carboxymuconolactone decarboxylase family protein [Micromonospora inaquosa]RQX04270.1 carboxymuconolactone decarboxylase family protein [Micromonospora inaquosa]